ncbi:MAG: hypothetical protein ACE5JR_13085 [Gemmatimonadota bacterium]
MIAVARDGQGSEVPASFSWTSSDSSILTVSPNGVARGVGFGAAQIRAEAAGAVGLASLRVVERPRRDRPDQFEGPKIHILYASSSARDRSASDMCDLVLSVQRSLASLAAWLTRLSNLALRIDHWAGMFAVDCPLVGPDISVVNLDHLSGPIYQSEALVRTIVDAGFRDADKIYAIYVEGKDERRRCGASFNRQYAFVYMQYTEITGRSCGNMPMTAPAADAALGAVDLVMMHEILHVLGAVHPSAPNSNGDVHVSDFDRDLMFEMGPDLQHSVLDVNCDDYYGNPVLGDIVDSPYLATVSFFLPTRCSKVLSRRTVEPGGFGDPID